MFALIILVIFGLGMAFFATQNTIPTSISIANYRFTGIPLYMIAIGSLLLGVFISWIISITDAFSSTLAIHGKDSKIKDADRAIENLKEEIHELEIENARLKGENVSEYAHPLKHSFT